MSQTSPNTSMSYSTLRRQAKDFYDNKQYAEASKIYSLYIERHRKEFGKNTAFAEENEMISCFIRRDQYEEAGDMMMNQVHFIIDTEHRLLIFTVSDILFSAGLCYMVANNMEKLASVIEHTNLSKRDLEMLNSRKFPANSQNFDIKYLLSKLPKEFQEANSKLPTKQLIDIKANVYSNYNESKGKCDFCIKFEIQYGGVVSEVTVIGPYMESLNEWINFVEKIRIGENTGVDISKANGFNDMGVNGGDFLFTTTGSPSVDIRIPLNIYAEQIIQQFEAILDNELVKNYYEDK